MKVIDKKMSHSCEISTLKVTTDQNRVRPKVNDTGRSIGYDKERLKAKLSVDMSVFYTSKCIYVTFAYSYDSRLHTLVLHEF